MTHFAFSYTYVRSDSVCFPGAMGSMKIPKNFKAGGKMPNMHIDANQMSKMLPPHMLQMMGGTFLTSQSKIFLHF